MYMYIYLKYTSIRVSITHLHTRIYQKVHRLSVYVYIYISLSLSLPRSLLFRKAASICEENLHWLRKFMNDFECGHSTVARILRCWHKTTPGCYRSEPIRSSL